MEGKRVRSKEGGAVFVMPGRSHVRKKRSRKDVSAGDEPRRVGI